MLSKNVLAALNEPIKPIPQTIALNEVLVQLGEMLFHDKGLSKHNNTSCASCHIAKQGLAENVTFSKSSLGEFRNRNTQGLFNSVYFSYFHWDGEFESLQDLSLRGMKDVTSNSWENVLKYIKQNDNYVTKFKQNFSDEITETNVSLAIAEYVKSYISPDSAFDQFLRGDKNALNQQQKNGYALFKNYGCVSCHNSMTMGGQMFAKLGQFGDYFKDRGSKIVDADLGRYRVSKIESDRYKFRVPSLRNIALTAPYFHDATQKTLKDAVQTMAKYQLGRKLPEQDTDAIVSFLKTLTGTFEGKPL